MRKQQNKEQNKPVTKKTQETPFHFTRPYEIRQYGVETAYKVEQYYDTYDKTNQISTAIRTAVMNIQISVSTLNIIEKATPCKKYLNNTDVEKPASDALMAYRITMFNPSY